MSYETMYRRWRPARFGDMIGQEHVRRTLQNALKHDRLSHAYLFCGPRGTGKTTAAKILAKAVNCENGPVPEPCNVCVTCRGIAEGRTMDVLEIDAASNRGIDEIRELREKVRYIPSECCFKFYIIDEVHMLTKEAFNALLKTLEEPPQRVIFVLATTEPHKVPATILSRCQCFDFRLLTVEELTGCLRKVSLSEEWTVEEEVLILLANLAEGSARDALGLLEQCYAYADGVIKPETVRNLFGITAPETIGLLVEAIADSDPERALKTMQQVVFSGKELALFARDLTLFLSRLLLLEAGSAMEQAAEGMPGFASLLDQSRKRFSYAALLEMIDLLNDLVLELRHTYYPHFLLEIAVLRLIKVNSYMGGQGSLNALLERVAVLEDKFEAEKIVRGVGESTRAAVVETAGSGRLQQSESSSMDKRESDETPVKGQRAYLSQLEKSNLGREHEQMRAESKQEPSPLAPPAHTQTQARTVPICAPACERVFSRLEKEWPQLLKKIKKQRAQAGAWLEHGEPRELEKGVLSIAFPLESELHKRNTEKEENRTVIEKVLSNFSGEAIRIKCELDKETNLRTSSLQEEHSAEQNDIGDKHLFESARQLFKGQVLEANGD